MKIWGLRLAAFFLLVTGAVSLLRIAYEHFPENIPPSESRTRNQEVFLENTGALLATWLSEKETGTIREYLQRHRAKGYAYALHDTRSGAVLLGNPGPEARRLARLGGATNRYASNAAAADRSETERIEVLPLQSAYGGPLVISLTRSGSSPPGEKAQPAGLYLAGLGLALLIAALLQYLSEQPLSRLRAAVRRLASGDSDIRLAPAILRRKDALGRLARECGSAAASLRQKQQIQRFLLSEISHEMSSPLSRLAVATELLQNAPPEKNAQLLARIREDTGQLNVLANQLRDFVRLQWLQAVREPVLLAPVLQKVVDACDTEAQESSRRVLLSTSGNGAVMGNAEQLASMFRNVIRNAVRHTPKDTHVEVLLKEETTPPDAFARISIWDKGPGLPEEDLERVLAPFQQGKTPAHGKTGLGLAIARQVATLHAGDISLQNSTEGGLHVTIRLPLCTG